MMERLDNILKDLGLDDTMTVVFEFMADKRKATFEQIYDGTGSREGLYRWPWKRSKRRAH